MRDLDPQCPYCQRAMQVSEMTCGDCGCRVAGHFQQPRLSQLPPTEAEFLADYVTAGCSLKELGERLNLSYPAVRARLDRVIAAMRDIDAAGQPRTDMQDILDRVERGELTAGEAAELMEGKAP